jgi:hypothetical protein
LRELIEISKLKRLKASHPYSIIKSLGAFAIVTVLGGMLANLLVELVKIIPH